MHIKYKLQTPVIRISLSSHLLLHYTYGTRSKKRDAKIKNKFINFITKTCELFLDTTHITNIVMHFATY